MFFLTGGRGAAAGIECGEVKNTAKHPTMHSIPHKKIIEPNNQSVKVKEFLSICFQCLSNTFKIIYCVIFKNIEMYTQDN